MNTWIFQGNPDRFDIDAYLSRARRILWSVQQDHLQDQMSPRDRVFLWRAAGRKKGVSGVLASAWITEQPRVQREDPAARDLWRGPQPDEALRVRLEVDRVANSKEIIQAAWLRDDPALRRLRILRMRNETNYLLEPEEAERISDLWENTGRDWNRAESLAGLWAYDRTYRQPVSRTADSPVGLVARRIGRAVSGVYNKVMNFRSLDPRDARTGLRAGSVVDRGVWDEFFDPVTNAIRRTALDTEFQRLWPEGSAAEPETVTAEEVVGVTTGRGGQGFVNDPAVRKAIENRAMTLAQQHYGARFTTVVNTSQTKPYDYCCRGAEGEVRVEVKGSTGDGGEVRLTVAEVENARDRRWRTDLFLVTNIRVTKTPEGPVAEGGTIRVLESWTPARDNLHPVVYRYQIPPGNSVRGAGES